MKPANDSDTETPSAEDRGRIAAATEKMRESVHERLETARAKAGDAYLLAREKGQTAYGAARERANEAYESTRLGVEANPLAALAGGLAFGALVAALLPAGRRERVLLGGIGKRLNRSAREAVKSAKAASFDKLDELGVSTVKEKLQQLTSGKPGSSDSKG